MTDLDRYLADCKFILVSNREPYEHVRGMSGIEVRQPPGGLVSALDPTMRAIHGTWVAWGSGSADHETADDLDDDIDDTLNRTVDNDPVLKERDIEFEVANGMVTIRGEVASAGEKAQVEQLAKAAPGVKDVANGLEIKAEQ